ncbi:GNAT family N-acetyltransferase [Actinomyces faecalis]|uniref:GNAT family N-acetyltransferase n=1 Tax=Actinomyces faecalis TaxID=2722820 RepID=UPI001551D2C3|nr:GNAT family N-acetyltransferase [Actinomyces faecalis]
MSPRHSHDLPSVFDTDPAAGLPHAQVPGTEQPAGFVRPAVPEDLEAIGRVHAAAMLASLRHAHAVAHSGTSLPAGVEAMIAPAVLTTGWEQAVTEPAATGHHVLVATAGQEVVGLLALAPTQGQAVDDDGEAAGAEPEPAAEVTALGVDPAHQRCGHGSRLLAAASDLARADGARVLLVWVVRGDGSLAGLLQACGLERTPSWRELPVGQGVVEECWAASLA